MSFISDKVNEYNKKQSRYSISDVEKIIADCILERAKRSIEHAIDRGETFVREKYAYDEGAVYCSTMYETEEQYLKSGSSYLYSFADLICPRWSADNSKQELRELVRKNQEKLNLMNIENMAREGIMNLGAKQVSVFVRFSEYEHVKIEKKGFFRNYYVEEKKPLGKYKICYTVFW